MFETRQFEYTIGEKKKVILSTYSGQEFIDIITLDDDYNVEGDICLLKSEFYDIYKVLEEERDGESDIGTFCIEGNFLKLSPWDN